MYFHKYIFVCFLLFHHRAFFTVWVRKPILNIALSTVERTEKNSFPIRFKHLGTIEYIRILAMLASPNLAKWRDYFEVVDYVCHRIPIKSHRMIKDWRYSTGLVWQILSQMAIQITIPSVTQHKFKFIDKKQEYAASTQDDITIQSALIQFWFPAYLSQN